MTTTMLSIRQAADIGVERLRQPQWINKLDHIRIDSISGRVGPWVRLFCPANKILNGIDPVLLMSLNFNIDEQDWEPYGGVLPESREYREAQAMEIKAAVLEAKP